MAIALYFAVAAATLILPPPPLPSDRAVTLANGIAMPRVLLGMGPWCNDPVRCPAPHPPCRDCYNDTAATADLLLALRAGFAGVDTALGYGNQAGVGVAVRAWNAPPVWVQTKVPGCRGATDTPASCANATQLALAKDVAELALGRPLDLVLVHSPPRGSSAGDACATAALCALAQAQWAVLERFYKSGATRAIGVSNFCATCLACLAQTRVGVAAAVVAPMVNQIQLHAGMPGADPTGLLAYCVERGIAVQAYSPLGNYATHSLLHANVTVAIGKQLNKSAAQVGLRWVLQHGSALCVAANTRAYLAEDVDVFDWSSASQS